MLFSTKPKINVSYKQLNEIYSEEKQSYKELLNKISSEYLNYNQEIKSVLDENNVEAYRKLRHKISSSLGLLEINEFNEYLLKVKEGFTIAMEEKENIKRIADECFEEIQTSIKSKLLEIN